MVVVCEDHNPFNQLLVFFLDSLGWHSAKLTSPSNNYSDPSYGNFSQRILYYKFTQTHHLLCIGCFMGSSWNGMSKKKHGTYLQTLMRFKHLRFHN